MIKVQPGAGRLLLGLGIWILGSGGLSAHPVKLVMDGPQASDNVQIIGDYEPADAPELPVLVMLHGLDSNRGEWLPLVKKARERGWGVLSYDARGQGESQKALNGAEVSIHNPTYARDIEFWRRMIDDAIQVVDFLHREEDIDYERIVLIGASLGANVSLCAADQKQALKGVVLMSPGLTYCGIRTEPAMGRWRRNALIIASRLDSYAAYSSYTLKKMGSDADVETLILSGEGAHGAHGTQLFDGHLETRILDWISEVWLGEKRTRKK